MKKLFPILFLLAPCVYACAADIPQDAAPDANAIVVGFDPQAKPNAVVPLPNDLAIATGKIVVPPTLDSEGKRIDSPAQIEFNEKYLGTLSGFPYESTASVTLSGNLDPATVNAKTVLALDVTDTTKPVAVTVMPTYADGNADGTVKPTITVAPPAGNWLRGHRYAIALLGGPNGVRGKERQDVIGSSTWALVKSRNPLVDKCDHDERTFEFDGPAGKQTIKTKCFPGVDIIPSHKEDPQEKLDEQTGLALTLEQIRMIYDPVLKYLAGPPVGVDRKDIPMLWTFSIVDAGEMTFDPANSVIPFPNDAVRTGMNGTVALPHPKTGKPLTAADCNTTDTSILLVCGLNTLDGFSMQAPLISENSDKEGAIAQASASMSNLIDAKSLDTKTVGLVPLVSEAPKAIQTAPKYTPCLNCASSKDAMGKPQTSPQQLQWRLDAPLDERTTYMGYVTNGVKDVKGSGVIANPVFALARSKNTLLDNSRCPAAIPPAKQAPCKDSKSAVSLITDAQAMQLEPLRAGYEAAFDALEKGGVPREQLALAFPFRTQSASNILDQLHGFPSAAGALFGLPSTPLFVKDVTAGVVPMLDAASPMIPHDKIQSFFAGAFLTPVAVTGPGGTLNPTKSKLLPVSFVIAVPTGTAPAGGWPVTIFGHGVTRWRNDVLALANSLAAAGQLVIASDVLWHGDRTSCTGYKAVSTTMPPSDDDACVAGQKCDGGFQGLCVDPAGARNDCAPSAMDPLGDLACLGAGQGRCAADKKCQGALGAFKPDASGTGKPEASGWNEFSLTNFFATRDNFRQQIIDLSQLVNVLKNADPTKSLAKQLAVPFDVNKMGYVGQSLGGILGTLFASVSPDLHNVVLNVPGGALVQIILNAPSFASAKKALFDTLAAAGLQPGTPGFDQFLGIAQWVLDEADPAVMGYRLTHSVDVMGGKPAPPADRKAFIQFIEGDETVPNISNLALVAGANRTFDPTMPPSLGCKPPLYCYEFTEKGDMFDATSAPTNARHGFLLRPPSAGSAALTVKAQTQAAMFLANGALP